MPRIWFTIWPAVVALLLFSPLAFGAGRILIIGDSLTEGLGVSHQQAYPARLEQKLKKSGCAECTVINAGVSGATTASGLKTMRFHVNRQTPDLVIYALGANDALRGFSPAQTSKNIEDAIKFAQEKKIKIILAGMQAPPNYGEKFTREFAAIFKDLAAQYKIPLIPFLLEGVAGEPRYNQADGIHPNEKGYEVITETVYQNIKPLL